MERSVREIRKDLKDLKIAVTDRTDAIDKTLDAASQLARSMEELVQRQKRRERLLQANSFAAYLLFTLLLGGGFWVLFNSRSGDLVAARDEARASAAEAREELRALQDNQLERQAGEVAAVEFYELVRSGRSSEVIAGYSKVEGKQLSPAERAAFEDSVKRARSEIVDAGFMAGVEAFRRGDYEAAAAELRRGLSYGDDGERAAQMRYYLGVSLHRQGEQEEAVHQLELAIAGRVEEAGIQEARFHLANTLMQGGKFEEARDNYLKFAERFPGHRLAQAARRKGAQILRAAREQARMAREAPPPTAPLNPARGALAPGAAKPAKPATKPNRTRGKRKSAGLKLPVGTDTLKTQLQKPNQPSRAAKKSLSAAKPVDR
jgi:TolA-binding protein